MTDYRICGANYRHNGAYVVDEKPIRSTRRRTSGSLPTLNAGDCCEPTRGNSDAISYAITRQLWNRGELKPSV